ncbi:very short patch repair endonuclease [Kordiimonas aestuarii]|uniref:very short patch repair endonuclease n=1 Tax=Kordiimonas aestuarii TaxID=1005925 RepID=UPI0021D30557|nr:very short patch repair endonuclease [Kordiimonas aestuarii]
MAREIENRSARSAQMARIRAQDTKPEMLVRRALHAAGLRYRLHVRELPGTPDIVFPSSRVVLFVHGCFWHQHPDPDCRLARMPKSKLEFWRPKLEGNRKRDVLVRTNLERLGWEVVELWECQLNKRELAQFIKWFSTLIKSKMPKKKAAK